MQELKEIVEKSKKALYTLEETVDDLSEDLTEEAKEFWADLKKSFTGVNDKLKSASNDIEEKADELKTNLEVIEAREKLEKVKDSATEFTQKVSAKTEENLDIAALRAHLAKMEAEDLWEEKQKELSHEYHTSKQKVQTLATQAAGEIEEYFQKLTESFIQKSDKKV